MIEHSDPLYETSIPLEGRANKKVREALKDAGLHQWQLALVLGVGESTLIRRLRTELPEEEQDKIVAMIRNHTKEER